jgi:hypothetical protein
MDKPVDRLEVVASALKIQNYVDKIDEENSKRSEESSKETKELISALKDLNKKIEKVGKDDEPRQFKSLSKWFDDKISPIKKLTSLQGITEHMAAKAGPGLLGTVLGTAAEGIQSRSEQKERKKSFVASVLAGTETGRAWQKEHGAEKASQMALKLFNQREIIEKRISELKEKEKLLKGTGEVEGAGLDEEDEKRLAELTEELKKNREFFMRDSDKSQIEKEPMRDSDKSQIEKEPSKPESTSTKQLRFEFMQGIREGLLQEYESLTPEEKAEFHKNPEERAIMIEAAMHELSKISEEQLRELIRIADSLDENELENKEKLLETIKEKQEEIPTKKEEEKTSFKKLLESGMKMFSSGLKGLGTIFSRGMSLVGIGIAKLSGSLVSMLPGLASAMGPASAIAAAGVGGYMFGKNVVNPALNTVAEYLTGTEGETVGTSLYGAVDSIAGSKIGNMLGFRSDEQKSKEAEEKALIAFGQSKISKGEKISAEIAKAMVKNGIPVLADQIASKTDATKLGERESLVEAVETTADQIASKTDATKLGERESLVEAVETTADSITNNTEKKTQTAVVNAPTVVNNSTNNTTITNKPIRNVESSYVVGMNRKLVF